MTDNTNQQEGQQQADSQKPPETAPPAAASVPKKTIPHPSEVHPTRHDAVLAHVAEQFANGHYGVEVGSVHVEVLSPGRDKVTFTRTHNPNAPAEAHGLDLSQA